MIVHEFGELFGCGKTYVANISKNEVKILSMFQSNHSDKRVHASKTCGRRSEYCEINRALYNWYSITCCKNIHPKGLQLVEKAKKIVVALGKPEVKGSYGWLEKLEITCNIKRLHINV